MRLSNGETLLRWPLAQHILTQGWNGGKHNGIDLRCTWGGTTVQPVYAAEGGTVDWVQAWDGHTRTGNQSYGNCVRILHEPWKGGQLKTLYAHLSSVAVKSGQRVTEGQIIGYTGNTGNSYGAHLHYEVWWNGKRTNPLVWHNADYTLASTGIYTYGPGEHAVEAPDEPAVPEDFALGVDVSKYQGTIDWPKVAASGAIKFAILRVGSSDKSGPYVDPTFEANYAGAKAAGLKVGAYLYTYATTEADQNAELAVFLPALAGKTFDYPVFVDVEDGSLTGLGKDALTALIKRYMDIIDQKGFEPGWYSYTNYINANLDADALADYPLWVADYRQALGYTGKHMMWQYTSGGQVDGIEGKVDMNKDYSDRAAKAQQEAPAEPAAQLQKLCVVNASAALVAKAKALGLPVETAACTLIGPASNGDAMTIWQAAQADGSPYFASYTED